MYRCQSCGEVTPPGTPLNLVVVETRAVSYRNKVWNAEEHEYEMKESKGMETVREQRTCPSCLHNLEVLKEKLQERFKQVTSAAH